MKKIIQYIACFFFGHIPEPKLIEDQYAIFTKGCARCGCALGLPAMWKSSINLAPPGYTEEQKKEYAQFVQNRMQEVRDSVQQSI